MNISKRTFGNKMFWINKRLFDIFVCLLLIPLFFIISIILLFVNYFINPGSLFFIQDRMGKNCSVFSAVKFRTMVPVKEITRKYDDPIETSRITSFGKILRKSRIDELPQILNVLKGEMSLVGPRPLLTEYLPLYTPEQARRHDVRPGITGWAQVSGRNAISWNRKFALDVWYVDNRTIWLDLKIIWMTIPRKGPVNKNTSYVFIFYFMK